jgi:hypothetical protein
MIRSWNKLKNIRYLCIIMVNNVLWWRICKESEIIWKNVIKKE